ncbi:hypothetical protein VR46_05285 [Streptomyces sp. NRRL S-444]|nr:hypothetical protein VR46_05285 [Streptomyces sp. NRRL S-444]
MAPAAPAPAPADRREEAVLAYLRGSRELVEAQRDVLLGFLGAGSSAPRPPAEAPERPWPAALDALPAHGTGLPGRAAPGLRADAGAAPVPAANGRAAAGGQLAHDAGSDAGPRSAEEVMDVVLDIVHTRTGYPHDMLGPELDLEADLSIDSIKRVEIIGALADRIGLPQDPDGSAESAVEELSRLKTLSGIVDWVTSRTAAPADGLTAGAAGPAAAREPAADPPHGRAGSAADRAGVNGGGHAPAASGPAGPTAGALSGAAEPAGSAAHGMAGAPRSGEPVTGGAHAPAGSAAHGRTGAGPAGSGGSAARGTAAGVSGPVAGRGPGHGDPGAGRPPQAPQRARCGGCGWRTRAWPVWSWSRRRCGGCGSGWSTTGRGCRPRSARHCGGTAPRCASSPRRTPRALPGSTGSSTSPGCGPAQSRCCPARSPHCSAH